MIIGSKNKGDWSEFYALLYLIGQRVLYCADKDLNKLDNYYFPINKVIRAENEDRLVQYILNNSTSVEINIGGEYVKTMSSDEFAQEARKLYKDLKRASGRSFDIPHGEEFLNDIELDRLGMPSTGVADIKLDLHDINTGIDQIKGFSIKSYIGGAPTLLNASHSTNLIYEVHNIDDQKMDEVNKIKSGNKIQDRIKKILDSGCTLSYDGTYSSNFANNLQMIDSNMERIIAELLLLSYTTNETDCSKLIKQIEERNPLGYNRSGVYEYKFKEFLTAKALGMNPDDEWNGIDEANGGYIVVKEDGDVLAYHLYNRDQLKQYLFDNVKLERASTKRHDFASVYKDQGNYYINLNLQIRFK